MSKVGGKRTSLGQSKPKLASRTRSVSVGKTPPKATAKGLRFAPVGKARFEAVMKAAGNSGLLGEKSGRIGGRVSAALIEQAKRQTGIEGDTDLIEFALANVALTDDFSKLFKESRGKVDPTLKLGF
ncbi:hypothetical protein [uncultured Rhodoblastus sp.]|uniref:hypothetical protein n=1 Tax=uncultured Rhodoblastus sp. TaxID=543037 RepID=UPI0025D4F485|nr:hypothetical protein [uncultured Rhodoblastus sp.]